MLLVATGGVLGLRKTSLKAGFIDVRMSPFWPVGNAAAGPDAKLPLQMRRVRMRTLSVGITVQIKEERILLKSESRVVLPRRDFLHRALQALAGLSLGGITGLVVGRSAPEEMVWQLDPNICIQCEKCAVNCVLPHSAVKCVHSYSMCGYCDSVQRLPATGGQIPRYRSGEPVVPERCHQAHVRGGALF